MLNGGKLTFKSIHWSSPLKAAAGSLASGLNVENANVAATAAVPTATGTINLLEVNLEIRDMVYSSRGESIGKREAKKGEFKKKQSTALIISIFDSSAYQAHAAHAWLAHGEKNCGSERGAVDLSSLLWAEQQTQSLPAPASPSPLPLPGTETHRLRRLGS